MSYQGKSFSCNPKYLFQYINRHQNNFELIIVLNKKAIIQNAKIVRFKSILFYYHLATAKYFIVNTDFNHNIKLRKETVFLQTWHAAGAFKKFGLDIIEEIKQDKLDWVKGAQEWSYLLCSSPVVQTIYANAFGIKDTGKVKCTGIPRNDIFFNSTDMQLIRERFFADTRITKKIILYAPTFRDHVNNFELKLDLRKLKLNLSENYIIILRLHPDIAEKLILEEDLSDFVFDFSNYDDIQELLVVSDILVTDYSSVIFDFAITEKPIVFYPYDLTYYQNMLRGFYFEYTSFVPGPIVFTDEELTDILKNYDELREQYKNKVSSFARLYNQPFDGNSSARVTSLICGEEVKK
jgi:CDP-glycerol glycerophosphotransferase